MDKQERIQALKEAHARRKSLEGEAPEPPSDSLRVKKGSRELRYETPALLKKCLEKAGGASRLAAVMGFHPSRVSQLRKFGIPPWLSESLESYLEKGVPLPKPPAALEAQAKRKETMIAKGNGKIAGVRTTEGQPALSQSGSLSDADVHTIFIAVRALKESGHPVLAADLFGILESVVLPEDK